ncbi:RNA polymerase subunit sigma-70 [Rhizobium leguminosarum]
MGKANLAGRQKTRVPSHSRIFFSRAEFREGFSPLLMKLSNKTSGRPRHHPTDMQRRLVQVLAGQAVPQSEICRILAVSPKTLRRHFRRELDIGAAKLEAALIGHLLRLAAGDDDVALRAIIFLLRSRFGWSRYAPPPCG